MSSATFQFGDKRIDIESMRRDGKPKTAVKFVADERGHITYIDAKGNLKSNRIRPGRWYYGTRISGNLPLMTDLAALGVLDKDTVKKLVVEQETKRAKDSAAYAAKQALDNMVKAGVELLPAQRAKLKRMAKTYQ